MFTKLFLLMIIFVALPVIYCSSLLQQADIINNNTNKHLTNSISTEHPIQSLEEFLSQQDLVSSSNLKLIDSKTDGNSSSSSSNVEQEGTSEGRPPNDNDGHDESQTPIPNNDHNNHNNNNHNNKLLEVEGREVYAPKPKTTKTVDPLNATASPEPEVPTPLSHTPTTSAKPILQHWQVKGLLNVTHDYPLAYSQIICGYIWPLMAAITLFTNLMITFVLTQRDMRTPTNVVLTAIAIADIIPIVVPVPWFVYLFAMGNEKEVLYPPVTCYFYQHSTRSVSEVFYFLSTWLNVLLAIQDYLTACWPKLAKKYCQIKVVVIEIILLTLLAFLLNLPQALKLIFKPVKFYYNGQITWGCRALQARWFKDLVGEYVALYDDIFTGIIVIFVDGGPAILLITLTALLIKQLQRQRIQGHLLMEQARTASKRRRERHRQQEYEASARVMIFVLLAFLAVKIPFATTYTLMIIQSRFGIQFVEELVDFQKAITLTDLVFVLSYPINFTIFCCCSKKFRHKCAELLGECNYNTKTRADRWMSSISGSFASGDSFTSQANDKPDSLATISPLGRHRYSLVSATMNNNNNNNNYNNCNNSNIINNTISDSKSQLRRQSSSINNDSINKRSSLSALLKQESIEAAKKRLANCRSRTFDQDSSLDIIEGLQVSPEVFQFQPKRESLPANLSAELARIASNHQTTALAATSAATGAATADICESRAIDTYCDGENHFDFEGRDGEMSLPMDVDANFSALLEDGSLCLECIMRYEQLKSSRAKSMGIVGSCGGAVDKRTRNLISVGAPQAVRRHSMVKQQQQQQQQHPPPSLHSRRVSTTSADSAGWSISLPQPPPPPIHQVALQSMQPIQSTAQVRGVTPHIVTTKWESIREQRTSSGGSGSQDTQNSLSTRVNSRNFYTPTEEQLAVDEESAKQHSISVGSPIDTFNYHHQQDSAAGFWSDGWMSPSSATSATSNTQSDQPTVNRSVVGSMNERRKISQASRRDCGDGSDDGADADGDDNEATNNRNNQDQLSTPHQAVKSSLKASSSPGAGFLGLKQLSGFLRRSSDRSMVDESEDNSTHQSDPNTKSRDDTDHLETPEASASRRRRRTRGGVSNLAETKQRSLSLSNSNLTTLPNATGILADIFISTLMGPGGAVDPNAAAAKAVSESSDRKSKIKGKLKRDGR